MAILTVEQKRKYFENDASICPFCGSLDISGDSFDCEHPQAWQNVTCQDCGESWRDVYTLDCVETDDELDNPLAAKGGEYGGGPVQP